MFEIGPSLREARMRRGLTPADVQRAIRIRDRYLSAIEEEHWELLPGAAYAKGFLRTYAEFLGLNGNLYVDEFNNRFPHREDAVVAGPTPRPRRSRAGLLRPLLAVAAIVAVVAAVAAWQLRGSPRATATTRTDTSTTPATTSAPATSTAPAPRRSRPTGPAALATSAVLAATNGRVWLQVRSGGAGGAVLFEGVLEQGKTLPVKLAPRVWLRVGAPWNLEIRLAGRVVAGLPAHVANLILDGHGLSPAP